eukprot:COSAG05_NODE_4909_length_1331_cov_0.757305_1_plen_61_part_00
MYPDMEGDIESVEGASQCEIHPAVTLLRVYDRYLMTTEVVGNWRNWKKGKLPLHSDSKEL